MMMMMAGLRPDPLHKVCYQSATYFPQFDVSFPEKLLKIVATMQDF